VLIKVVSPFKFALWEDLGWIQGKFVTLFVLTTCIVWHVPMNWPKGVHECHFVLVPS
jgi:hypothetical protein